MSSAAAIELPNKVSSASLLETPYARRVAEAECLLQWVGETFGDSAVLSSSFGAESALMLDLVTRQLPRVRVLFVDTGFLFPETYRFVEELRERFDFDLRSYNPLLSAARLEACYGKLWEDGDDGLKLYNQLTKVEPTQRALRELKPKVWLAGLRSNQTNYRAALQKVDEQDGVVKVSPILDWSQEDIKTYMEERELPYHPLYHKGYRSIGDTHSTFPTKPGEDPRLGRRLGSTGECGMHMGYCERQS
jgi:phosphoadenosine phosphosulfate reductase